MLNNIQAEPPTKPPVGFSLPLVCAQADKRYGGKNSECFALGERVQLRSRMRKMHARICMGALYK